MAIAPVLNDTSTPKTKTGSAVNTAATEAIKSLSEAAARIAAGTSVVIFPEGTRSRDGRLGEFKSGAMHLAIKAGVPVVPVAIGGTHRLLPEGSLLPRPGHVRVRAGGAGDARWDVRAR